MAQRVRDARRRADVSSSVDKERSTFLIETDPSVQIPPEMAIAIASHIPGIPKDMQPVVGLESGGKLHADQ